MAPSSPFRRLSLAILPVVLLLLPVLRAHAQEAPVPHTQVISANPFGLLLELFNAEYERTVLGSSTAGVGGSFASPGDESYVNADVFYRLYPSGRPLDGFALGVKAGVTSFSNEGSFAGVGFDVNYSWLLGQGENLYVGVGFGLKRLYGVGDADIGINYIPTFRIVNVGLAF